MARQEPVLLQSDSLTQVEDDGAVSEILRVLGIDFKALEGSIDPDAGIPTAKAQLLTNG